MYSHDAVLKLICGGYYYAHYVSSKCKNVFNANLNFIANNPAVEYTLHYAYRQRGVTICMNVEVNTSCIVIDVLVIDVIDM